MHLVARILISLLKYGSSRCMSCSNKGLAYSLLSSRVKHPETKIIQLSFTFALSSDSANAFEDDTSRFRPTEEAVRSNGSSISFVGLG